MSLPPTAAITHHQGGVSIPREFQLPATRPASADAPEQGQGPRQGIDWVANETTEWAREFQTALVEIEPGTSHKQ